MCLHWHHHTVFFSATSYFTGCSPVPLCAPSQKGGWPERPQEHHQCTPASTSSASGLVSQINGFSLIGSESSTTAASVRGGNPRNLIILRCRHHQCIRFGFRNAARSAFIQLRIPLRRHLVQEGRPEPSRENDRRTTHKFADVHEMIRECLLFPWGEDCFDSVEKATQNIPLSAPCVQKGVVVTGPCP